MASEAEPTASPKAEGKSPKPEGSKSPANNGTTTTTKKKTDESIAPSDLGLKFDRQVSKEGSGVSGANEGGVVGQNGQSDGNNDGSDGVINNMHNGETTEFSRLSFDAVPVVSPFVAANLLLVVVLQPLLPPPPVGREEEVVVVEILLTTITPPTILLIPTILLEKAHLHIHLRLVVRSGDIGIAATR